MLHLSERITSVTIDACVAEVRRLEPKDGEVIVFSLPDNFDYDTNFFDHISEIFQDRNIQVIAMHKGINIDIIGKNNVEES
jgi:hypothetical protein